WYGWQTLTSDGLGVVTFGTGWALWARSGYREDRASQVLIGAGFAGLLAGAPVVHWAHANTGKGVASLGVRMGATILVASAGQETGKDPAFALAGLALFSGVSVIDAAIFGYL